MIKNNKGLKLIKNNSAWPIILMAIATFLSKFLGFLRGSILISLYGASAKSDIILTAMRIPIFCFDLAIGGMLSSSFVPKFNEILQKRGRQCAFNFSNHFITRTILLTSILSIFGIVFSSKIVKFMVPNFSPEKIRITSQLVKILFPSIIFISLTYLFIGIFQSFDKFIFSSFTSLFSNLFVILYLILIGDSWGLFGIAGVVLISWIAQFCVQLLALKTTNYRYKIKFSKLQYFSSKNNVWISSLVTSWATPICLMANLKQAARIGDGFVSIFDISNNIYLIISSIFSLSITNFIFPKLSKMASAKREEFKQTLEMYLEIGIYISAFLSCFVFTQSFDIVKIMYKRGKFDDFSLYQTGLTLKILSIGIVSITIIEILNKTFYSLSLGIGPLTCSVFGLLVNFLGNFIALKINAIKIEYLAISLLLGNIANAISLLFLGIVKIKKLFNFKFICNILKIIICSILTCFLCFKFNSIIQKLCLTIRVPVSLLTTGFLYLLFTYLFKTNEIKKFKEVIKCSAKSPLETT